MKMKLKCWGIADGDTLLAVYLDREVAVMQLQYFKHRNPRLVEFTEVI